MNILFIISYILLAIYTVASLTIQIIQHYHSKKQFDLNNFDIKTLEAAGQIKKKQEAAEKEYTKELDNKLFEKRLAYDTNLQNLRNEFAEKEDELRITYRDKNEAMHDEFIKRRKEYEELDTAAQRELKEKMEFQLKDADNKYLTALSQIENSYKEKKIELDEDFFRYKEDVSFRKQKISEDIKKYEDKQREIIQRFKADEENRQKLDFYKIKISEEDKKDIQNLKRLSSNFSKPDVLYKVIYEIYYKTKLEEMFKRVLANNRDKGGIYKITNINNNKVYIGKTTNFINRWRTHAKRGCGLERITGQLYTAMFEDGLENYMWEIVEICSKEEQTEKEKEWIRFYNSCEYGFNQKVG